jgi:O-antigen/teichoic acid export membrane protein
MLPKAVSDVPANTKDDAAVTAGRGVAFIGIAKMYFIGASSILELVLPRLLGAARFGAYGIVNQAVSILNNLVVTGTIQAVSRYTTADPARADAVKASGIRMHLVIGLPIAILFAALSPAIAHFFHDPSKTPLLALSAGIFAAYAFYSVFVGSANGVRAFHKQAALDITFATLRVAAIVSAAVLGFGVWGAIGGWLAAAVAILLIAAIWVGLPRGDAWRTADKPWPMAFYLLGLALYLLTMNLFLSADQFLLKRLSAEWFLGHGSTLVDAAHLADEQVGLYRPTQVLARLPYQLMLAVTFVVFPLVSRSTFEKDEEKTRSYIRTTMRYSLIFSAAMGTVLAANPTALLDVPFQPAFAEAGGPALAALALGHVAFVLFTIAGTILNGAGRTLDAIVVSAFTLALLVAGLWLAIPRVEPGREMLFACAVATAAAMTIGAIASGWLLVRRFRAFVPPLTVVRVLLAVGACMGLGRVVPVRSPILTLAMAGLTGLLFLGILVVTRELGRADLAAVSNVLRRRRS